MTALTDLFFSAPLRTLTSTSLGVAAHTFKLIGLPRTSVKYTLWSLKVRDATRPSPRLLDLIQWACKTPTGEWDSIRNNKFLQTWVASEQAESERRASKQLPESNLRRMHLSPDEDPHRQGDLIILRAPDPETGEPGVLLITYTSKFATFAAIFDLPTIAQSYIIVLEPSGWGYQAFEFLLFLGADARVIVQSSRPNDFKFIENLKSNLVPLNIGASSWVDPAVFQAGKDHREYDLAIVSSWSRFKRHAVIFKAIASIKKHKKRALKIALLGFPGDLVLEDIQRIAKELGVEEQCDFFDRLLPEKVGDILGNAKASIVFSKREGSCRAIYESMFCNTPVIVYKHHLGINLDHVNEKTGALSDDSELPEVMLNVISNWSSYSPRAWVLDKMSFKIATSRLNECIRTMAIKHGFPHHRDIVTKKNFPENIYVDPENAERLKPAYQQLPWASIP